MDDGLVIGPADAHVVAVEGDVDVAQRDRLAHQLGDLIAKADGNAWEYTGAYFTSAWVEQEISFEGWRNGQLLFASGAYTLETTAPRWIQLDWAGIDTLVVYNSSPTAWAMDEFTVPEPGSLALMGTSLLGLMAARRRERPV